MNAQMEKNKINMRWALRIALGFALIWHVGCLASAPISQMGRAAGGAPVSFGSLGGGEGESFWLARYDDVIVATLRAAEALSLEVKTKKIEQDRTFFRFYDTQAENIKLVIERRTATMTAIRFDVGWFGSMAFARLMARQIIFELDESGSFLEDWAY